MYEAYALVTEGDHTVQDQLEAKEINPELVHVTGFSSYTGYLLAVVLKRDGEVVGIWNENCPRAVVLGSNEYIINFRLTF